MGINQRLEIIRQIEEVRGSKVLCFLTGDRRGYETRIHPEVHTMFYDHLQGLTAANTKIDLFLYSTGGVTMAAWSIISLLREYCQNLAVIVPFKSFSTATLICLGADEIIMGKLGQLGPVDPSVTMPFNPSAPGNLKGQVLPISVEEVANFIAFARDTELCGLKSEEAFSFLLTRIKANGIRKKGLGDKEEEITYGCGHPTIKNPIKFSRYYKLADIYDNGLTT